MDATEELAVESSASVNDQETAIESKIESKSTDSPTEPTTSANPMQSRLDRFKALQALNKTSRNANLKETKAETQRLSTDPQLLSQLERKRATATHKLLKDETPDFERKRAWDWTAEESEKWDKRLEKKARNRDNVAFADYRTDANKTYKRQLKNMGLGKGDARARYEEEKQRAVQKAAERGGLELVETEDGELIAVDKDGTFYSTADSTDFVQNKPDKEAVDRLVNDIRKAEEARLKERRKRGIKDEDDSGDITYINQKNKQFNEKLARFYNKYTSDIRESFERGTAI